MWSRRRCSLVKLKSKSYGKRGFSKSKSYGKRGFSDSEIVDLKLHLSSSSTGKDESVKPPTKSQVLNERQMASLKNNESIVMEREREIKQVATSVNELAQIMKDLSVLVIDQGTIVDRIDYNIQNVAASVEAGFMQLQKAERNQKHGGW